MPYSLPTEHKTWTVAEAKARLSEVLRRAGEEGPQYIGTRKTYVVVSAEDWQKTKKTKQPMGQWLLENMPTTGELELPDRKEPERAPPFQ